MQAWGVLPCNQEPMQAFSSAKLTRQACAKRNSCCHRCRRYQVLLNDEHLQDAARANAIFAPADDNDVIQVTPPPTWLEPWP